jgi:hypothetical protein
LLDVYDGFAERRVVAADAFSAYDKPTTITIGGPTTASKRELPGGQPGPGRPNFA